MPEPASPKTANPKSANASSATVPAPPTASSATAAANSKATAGKALPQKTPPLSTGSPLLDSFLSSRAEKTVYIPNPHIMGDRLDPRQGPSFRNVTLNGPTAQRDRTRFDSEDFRQAGIASAAVPIKKSSKAIQLNGQSARNSSEKSSEPTKTQPAKTQPAKTQTHRPSSEQAAAPAQQATKTLSSKGTPPQGPSKQNSPSRPNGQKTVKKPPATPPVTPASVNARQRPQPGSTAPGNRQNGSRPTAAPTTFKSAAASGSKVYGGSDYKALQSRAAAGGLVDLDDTLLFGGAEDKSSPLSIGNAPPGADNGQMAVLEYLLALPSDFTLTKPKDNRAILDDFSWLEKPAFIPTQAVIDARNFQVVEQPKPQTQTLQPQRDPAGPSDSAELKALTQKIDQLHQRIEYLSKRLASFDDAPSSENAVTSPAALFDTVDIDLSPPTASALFQEPSIK